MPKSRSLPKDRNGRLEKANAPDHDDLIERRCLGQTELKVKPGQVGTTNATKPGNLGILDYAHLRVPLPNDLDRSGIFQKGRDRKHPEAYFLMRRSSDGFVSATGMYKAAFPYSSIEEEAAEKEYIKTLPAASEEEIAGNVWVHPDQALVLADEYGIKHWIIALLDPSPITHGSSDTKRSIQSPPAYKVKDLLNGAKSPKTDKKSVRGKRSVKSASPAPPEDGKASARKIATPRKARKGRKATAEDETDAVNGDKVTVEVETTKAPAKEEKTTVNIEMPANSPSLKLPKDADGMLEKAREMVAEADKLGSKSTGKGKRKAKDTGREDEDTLPAKRAKMEVDLRKEKIKRRALTGIAASLTIGALVPTALTFLGWS